MSWSKLFGLLHATRHLSPVCVSLAVAPHSLTGGCSFTACPPSMDSSPTWDQWHHQHFSVVGTLFLASLLWSLMWQKLNYWCQPMKSEWASSPTDASKWSAETCYLGYKYEMHECVVQSFWQYSSTVVEIMKILHEQGWDGNKVLTDRSQICGNRNRVLLE